MGYRFDVHLFMKERKGTVIDLSSGQRVFTGTSYSACLSLLIELHGNREEIFMDICHGGLFWTFVKVNRARESCLCAREYA